MKTLVTNIIFRKFWFVNFLAYKSEKGGVFQFDVI